MHNAKKPGWLLALGFASAAAFAEGKSYMALVGELMGSIESPRMIRDYCAANSPDTAAENSRLYEAWKERHKELLQAIADQVARANIRMKKQGAGGGDEPSKVMVATAEKSLTERMQQLTPDQLKQLCAGFPALIEKKEREATTSIPELLYAVSEADKALSARE